MNLPKSGHESADMLNHRICGDTLVAELTFLVKVVINRTAQVFPVQITHRITVEHPFAFGDVVIPEFSCMFEDPFDTLRCMEMNPPVEKSID